MIKPIQEIISLNGIDGLEEVFPIEKLELLRKSFIEMQLLYKSAIKEIRTKLEILDDEFKFKYKRNPIHSIKSRIKSPDSILYKLNRKGLDLSIEAAKSNITDIAGIRVICSYIDDIYLITKLIKLQDDIVIIRERDYIKNPKPNGYRSYHIVLKIPVFFSDKTELVPIEVQIRTIAMDFWASLEHQLHYKSEETIPASIINELQKCAETIAETDFKMQEIYNELEKLDDQL